MMLAVSFALGAFAPAASADVSRHLLELYKAERHVDLEGGDYVEADVACLDRRDIAVDGMWRIDHVDVEEDGNFPLGDVDVYRAEASRTDPSQYQFGFYNNGEGRAQVKIFATCLGRDTDDDHQHLWQLDAVKRHYSDYTLDLDRHELSLGAKECRRGELAVSPGFDWDRGYGEIYRSGSASASLRGWSWGFFVSLLDEETGDARVRLSHRCLRLRSSAAGNGPHAHRIVAKFHPEFPPPPTTIAAGALETRTRTCGHHEKAMLHWFELDPYFDSQRFWFLGMDPRLKSRAYRVWNRDSSSDHEARFGAVCFNDRSSLAS